MAHNDPLIDLDVARIWLERAAAALGAGQDSSPDAVAYAHAAGMIGHGFVGLAHTVRSFDAMADAAKLTARQIAAVDALTDEIHGEPTLGAAIERERQALAEARPHDGFRGFTRHGHPVDGEPPAPPARPAARCGGLHGCAQCAADAARLRIPGRTEADLDD